MRLGIIEYINLFPVTYALENRKVDFDSDITKGPPTKLNSMLSGGMLDASFISSIEYARGNYILLPFSISAKDEVKSVLLLSHVPVNRIKRITLTSESATSVVLLKILMNRAFNHRVEYGVGGEAELLIGDKALQSLSGRDHTLDLAKAWHDLTGLPMVFGVLAARKETRKEDLKDLISAIESSIKWAQENKREVLKAACLRTGLQRKLVEEYYGCLHFGLGPDEVRSLKKFYSYAKSMGGIDQTPPIQAFRG